MLDPSAFRAKREWLKVTQVELSAEIGVSLAKIRERELSDTALVPDEWLEAAKRVAARKLEAVDG